MHIIHLLTIYLILGYNHLLVSSEDRLNEGDPCTAENASSGNCSLVENCNHAKELIQATLKPKICGFQGTNPLVCCPLAVLSAIVKQPVNYNDRINVKKCIEYNPRHPWEQTGIFIGVRAEPREFPHMAILGYGDETENQWLCGGSLISDRIILTAAHCIFSAELGTVSRVRLGELDLNNTNEDAKPQDFTVSRTIIHPDYKPPSHYNDIALIELDHQVHFNNYIRPACLFINHTIPIYETLIASGWGKTNFAGSQSSYLLKAEIKEVKHAECAKRYQRVSTTKLQNGIVDIIQICAGDEEGRDACPGDSGGPLQVKHTWTLRPMYFLVGVTSFGKACGVENSAGVYARVSGYAEWIEEMVWPQKK